MHMGRMEMVAGFRIRDGNWDGDGLIIGDS